MAEHGGMKSSSIVQAPRSRSGRVGSGRYVPAEYIPTLTRKTTKTLTHAATCYKCRQSIPAGAEGYWSRKVQRWRHPACRPQWTPGERFKKRLPRST